jgi:hypothetical protein
VFSRDKNNFLAAGQTQPVRHAARGGSAVRPPKRSSLAKIDFITTKYKYTKKSPLQEIFSLK